MFKFLESRGHSYRTKEYPTSAVPGILFSFVTLEYKEAIGMLSLEGQTMPDLQTN